MQRLDDGFASFAIEDIGDGNKAFSRITLGAASWTSPCTTLFEQVLCF
jgi:hypothetical protein